MWHKVRLILSATQEESPSSGVKILTRMQVQPITIHKAENESFCKFRFLGKDGLFGLSDFFEENKS